MDTLNQKMKFYDGRLVEINALLNNTAVVNRPAAENNNTNFVADNVSNSLDVIKNSLESIKDYVVLDPYRAKVELENIISSI
jgi:two-component system sensor histidine kinase DegS